MHPSWALGSQRSDARRGDQRETVAPRATHLPIGASSVVLRDRTDDRNVPRGPARCHMDGMYRAASCLAALYQRAVTDQPVSPGGQRQPEPAVLADGHCKARARRIYGHHLPGQRDSTAGRRAAYPDELARHPSDGCRGYRPPGAAPGNRRRRREHGHDRAQRPPHARLDVPPGDLVVPPRDFWPNSTETRPVRHAGALRPTAGALRPTAEEALLSRRRTVPDVA